MAETMVQIRSVQGYFKAFAIEAIGKKHQDRELVKYQILDAFQKEIFGQIVGRYGDPNLLAKDAESVDPEVKRGVDNILKNSLQKWKKLVKMFGKYRETANLIYDGDLMSSMDDIVKIQTNDEKGTEETEEPEGTESDEKEDENNG